MGNNPVRPPKTEEVSNKAYALIFTGLPSENDSREGAFQLLLTDSSLNFKNYFDIERCVGISPILLF